MVFSSTTISDIKEKSGLKFDKTNDFGLLSTKIYQSTGRTIGITTLKRLFGYINDNRKSSQYTLNTIAEYLGYNSWADYSSVKPSVSEWGYIDTAIYPNSLEIGKSITIEYLDRKVAFTVADCKSQKVLKVTDCKNGSLMQGDILFVHKIKKGEILEAEKVVRGSMTGNYKTGGEITSVKIE